MGNHEFDQGYDDLVNRVMAPTTPTTTPRRRRVEVPRRQRQVQAGRHADAARRDLDPRTSATSQVGFVGAVTEDLPALVIAGRHRGHHGDRHRRRDQRRRRRPQGRRRRHGRPAGPRGRAVHRAAPSATDPSHDFGKIVNGVNADVDAIVSGHTHLAYNHRSRCRSGRRAARSPSVRWSRRASTARTSTSCVFTVDTATGEVAAMTPVDPRRSSAGADCANYPADADGRRRSSTTPWRRPTCWVRSVLGPDRGSVQPGQARPTAPPRTVVASPRSATWWPRCSGGRRRDARGRRGADRVHEPGRSACRHGRHGHRRVPAT